MAPKAKKADPASMLEQAIKSRDEAQKDHDKNLSDLAKAEEKVTTAEKVRDGEKRNVEASQVELAEAQRLVDALAVLVDDAPNPQTVAPDGVESGEGVMTDADRTAEPVA